MLRMNVHFYILPGMDDGENVELKGAGILFINGLNRSFRGNRKPPQFSRLLAAFYFRKVVLVGN